LGGKRGCGGAAVTGAATSCGRLLLREAQALPPAGEAPPPPAQAPTPPAEPPPPPSWRLAEAAGLPFGVGSHLVITLSAPPHARAGEAAPEAPPPAPPPAARLCLAVCTPARGCGGASAGGGTTADLLAAPRAPAASALAPLHPPPPELEWLHTARGLQALPAPGAGGVLAVRHAPRGAEAPGEDLHAIALEGLAAPPPPGAEQAPQEAPLAFVLLVNEGAGCTRITALAPRVR